MPTLTTLVNFDGADGANPVSGLLLDSAGDLFGTTYGDDGATSFGTVFELTKTDGNYSSEPITLVSFNGSNGSQPRAGLIADGVGDLFGTTSAGGANNGGTVFEIPKTSTSYASTPITLVSFNSSNGYGPYAGLIIDAAGDLFGTTSQGGPTSNGGATGSGTVFEIVKTAAGYASAPTTLVSFDGNDGEIPTAGLIMDVAGDLFGTTKGGGASGFGTVFEIVKTAAGYAGTPTTLVSFDGQHNGQFPAAALIMDVAGDLFGTTEAALLHPAEPPSGSGDGTVFELVNNGSGGFTFATLVSFNGTDGFDPEAGLIIDARGDLFGTTAAGGAYGAGTVFEIAKTSTGYASTPITLVSFNGNNGDSPAGGLVANAAGDLFGTTNFGGANKVGTVFELSGATGFRVAQPSSYDFNGDGDSDVLWQNDNGQPAVWLLNNAAPFNEPAVGGNPGPSWQVIGAGDFNGDGDADILWQNTNGQPAVWLMNGTTPFSEVAVGSNPGPSWQVIGAGDFNGDGDADILFQNTNGQAAVWLMNGTTPFSEQLVGANPGPSWHIVGTGDFNGDGDADILWQNTSGQAAIWLMNGTTPLSETVVGNPGPSWHIVGTGDFNGDGDADILWQNTNGQAAIWLMNCATPFSEQLVGANPGPSWQIVGAGDYNGDGKSDILWQNTNGQASIWLMNGTTPTFEGLVGSNPGPTWHIHAAS